VQHPVENDANGIRWYFNSGWSWGFAPAGDTVNLAVSDTLIGTDANLRLSWDTTGLSGGYRAGSLTSLQNSTAYERLVYQSDGPTATAGDSGSFSVVPEPTTALMSLVISLGMTTLRRRPTDRC
jgi:hypothetical protein